MCARAALGVMPAAIVVVVVVASTAMSRPGVAQPSKEATGDVRCGTPGRGVLESVGVGMCLVYAQDMAALCKCRDMSPPSRMYRGVRRHEGTCVPCGDVYAAVGEVVWLCAVL